MLQTQTGKERCARSASGERTLTRFSREAQGIALRVGVGMQHWG